MRAALEDKANTEYTESQGPRGQDSLTMADGTAKRMVAQKTRSVSSPRGV